MEEISKKMQKKIPLNAKLAGFWDPETSSG